MWKVAFCIPIHGQPLQKELFRGNLLGGPSQRDGPPSTYNAWGDIHIFSSYNFFGNSALHLGMSCVRLPVSASAYDYFNSHLPQSANVIFIQSGIRDDVINIAHVHGFLHERLHIKFCGVR